MIKSYIKVEAIIISQNKLLLFKLVLQSQHKKIFLTKKKYAKTLIKYVISFFKMNSKPNTNIKIMFIPSRHFLYIEVTSSKSKLLNKHTILL